MAAKSGRGLTSLSHEVRQERRRKLLPGKRACAPRGGPPEVQVHAACTPHVRVPVAWLSESTILYLILTSYRIK